jgi:hypothetical protein
LLTAASYPFVAHVAEPLAVFRDHSGSISHQHQTQLGCGYAKARLWFWLFSIARMIHT